MEYLAVYRMNPITRLPADLHQENWHSNTSNISSFYRISEKGRLN